MRLKCFQVACEGLSVGRVVSEANSPRLLLFCYSLLSQ